MRGFSLVELSIVLVILGLLTGGILTGQTLIRAAELRSVTTEFQRYQSAVNTFRDKYFALPGDMRNATDFWGIAAGTSGNDNTCRDTVQTTGATCNGDGDGNIPNGDEQLLFWKHLANAGLIEGTFPGTTPDNDGQTSPYTFGTTLMPGWNIPDSKLSNASWVVGNYGSWNVSIQKFYGNYPVFATEYYYNSIYFFDRAISPGTGTGGPITPDEAWNIDTKLDDGLPGSGSVEAFRGGGSTLAGPCLTNADPTLAEYDLADSVGSCAMVFARAF